MPIFLFPAQNSAVPEANVPHRHIPPFLACYWSCKVSATATRKKSLGKKTPGCVGNIIYHGNRCLTTKPMPEEAPRPNPKFSPSALEPPSCLTCAGCRYSIPTPNPPKTQTHTGRWKFKLQNPLSPGLAFTSPSRTALSSCLNS